MLCECQEKYLERLKKRDQQVKEFFSTSRGELSPEGDLEIACPRLCEKAKKLATFHLQAETQLVCQLGDRKLDPQHFQLLVERFVALATL
jgi:hypothetical protein